MERVTAAPFFSMLLSSSDYSRAVSQLVKQLVSTSSLSASAAAAATVASSTPAAALLPAAP